MDPLTKFIIAIGFTVLATIIATVKRRSGWMFLLVSGLGTPALTAALSYATRGNDLYLTIGFLGLPSVALFIAIFIPSRDEMISLEGSFKGKRRCPICAGLIQVEALKCKQCGSEVEPITT